jgi:hypothetical protein
VAPPAKPSVSRRYAERSAEGAEVAIPSGARTFELMADG